MTLEAIQAALAAATPGPWVRGYESSGLRANTIHAGNRENLPLASIWLPLPWRDGSGSEAERRGQERERQADADAHLIANAPQWLQALVDVAVAALREIRAVVDRQKEDQDLWLPPGAPLGQMGEELLHLHKVIEDYTAKFVDVK